MYIHLRDLFWGKRAYLTYWYAFLLSFPFSWRKVLIPSVAGGSFNEYMDFSLYVGDILILSTIILIIKHNINIKSILDKLKLFHVEHRNWLLLGVYLILSFLWSENKWLWLDGILGFLRIIGISSIFIFSLKDRNCSTWNNLRTFTVIITLGVLFQSFLAGIQFFANHSFGLKFLGESSLSALLPSVAKVDDFFGRHIRAYGTFLHPNILGGYIVLSILLLVFTLFKRKQLFHVEQKWLVMIVFLALSGLFFSFSKSAWFSLVLCLLVYMFHVEHFSIKKIIKHMFHVEHMLFIISFFILIITFFILGMNQIDKSISERLAINTLYVNQNIRWVVGNGINQSVYTMSSNYPYLETWKLQPVHNIYVDMFLDMGIIGSLLICILLWKILKYVPRGTYTIFWLPLIAIGIIGMFDHYLWDIYAGQVILALVIGWTVSTQYTIDK